MSKLLLILFTNITSIATKILVGYKQTAKLNKIKSISKLFWIQIVFLQIISTYKMCFEDNTQELQELKNIISGQKQKISKLNKKLEEFEALISERNELKKICQQFEQNKEDSYNAHKKSFNELSDTCNDQSEKIKKVMDTVYQWELKYEKLENTNNCLNNQLNILKCNVKNLESQLAETEIALKSVQNELCLTKSELEEKDRIVCKLKTNLKCNEQELYKVCKDLEECKTACNKLNETNEKLNMDLKSTKKSLCDTKLCATRMEGMFTQEREHLSNEFKISCKKINDLEIRYDEAMCKLNDERCKSKKFASKLIEVNKVTAKNHLEMKNRVQKLQEEICAKNKDLGCWKKKVIELQQENESKCTEISTLKNKLNEREYQLKQMGELSEKLEEIKTNVEVCCCPKTSETGSKEKCETNPCPPKNKCKITLCCPKKKSEADSCCPKQKSETVTCCPKKKCKITICCPKKISETDSCCPKKKCTTDMKSTYNLSNNTKAINQKHNTKSSGSDNDMYSMELRQLKCDLEELLLSIGYIL